MCENHASYHHVNTPLVLATISVYDKQDLLRYVQVDDAYAIISEIANWLRNRVKFPPEELIALSEEREIIYKQFLTICQDYNIEPFGA